MFFPRGVLRFADVIRIVAETPEEQIDLLALEQEAKLFREATRLDPAYRAGLRGLCHDFRCAEQWEVIGRAERGFGFN